MFRWADGNPVERARFVIDARALLARAGVDDGTKFNGISLRRGGAKSLKLAGAFDIAIMMAGRWSSDCFRRYIETHRDEILQEQRNILETFNGFVGASSRFVFDGCYFWSLGRCSYFSMKTHMLSNCRKPRLPQAAARPSQNGVLTSLLRYAMPQATARSSQGHPGPKASQSTDTKHPKQKEEDLQNKLYILYRLDRISELALPWLIIAGSSSPISSWRACSKISKQSRPRSGAVSHPPGRSSSSSNRYISKLKNVPTAAAVRGTQLSVLVHYAQDSGRLRLVQEERLSASTRGAATWRPLRNSSHAVAYASKQHPYTVQLVEN
eukprot:g13128.t1